MSKNILEKFSKYMPDSTTRAWLEGAVIVGMRANRERRIIEIDAAMPCIVDKEEI